MIDAHLATGREVFMIDTNDVWQAVEDALNFSRVRMQYHPYYSEASKFEAVSGTESHCLNK